MEHFNKTFGDGGEIGTPGSNEEVLRAQHPLALDGGQPARSSIRPGGDAQKEPSVEQVPLAEPREGTRTRHPSTRPGPRCAKEGRMQKEVILVKKRKKAEEMRRTTREKDIAGRRSIPPIGPEAEPFVRMMPRASSSSTIDDVSDSILGEMEDPPVLAKEPSREVSPAAFPRANAPPANGSKRGRGRPPTSGDFVGYAKAKEAANAAKQKALDLEAEETVSRTGLAAKARLEKDSQKSAASDGAKSTSLAAQRDGADLAAKSVSALRADANLVAEAVLRVATTSGHLKGTYQKELKVAADMVRNLAGEFGRRVELTGDVSHLQAENARLNVEVMDLRGEVRALKAMMEVAKERWGSAPPPVQAGEPAPTPPTRAGEPAPPPAPEPPSTGAPRPMELAGGPVRASGRKRNRVVDTSTSDSDGASPPAKVAGGEAKEASVRPPVTGPDGGADLLLERIGALVERKMAEGMAVFRAELGLNKPQGPRVVREEKLPPGTVRVERAAGPAASKSGTARPAVPSGGSGTRRPSAPAKKQEAPPRPQEGGGRRRKGKAPSSAPPSEAKPQLGTPKSGGGGAPPPQPTGEVWSKVVGRRARKAGKSASGNSTRPSPAVPGKSTGGGAGRPPKAGPRLPRSAGPPAITLTAPVGGEWSLDKAMSKLTEEIPIEDLGIEGGLRPKRAVTGALMFEVPGPEGAEKADRLARRMEEVLEGTGVKVARPCKRAELRVRDLVDSTTPGMITQALARACECPEGDVKVGNVTRRSPSELGTAWAQVPLAAARKLLQGGGKLALGWVLARVEPLSTRPLQCYRCLAPGHARQRCESEVDRSDRCYRCGQPGHRAADCSSAPNCPLCADSGRPSGHRLGAPSCMASAPARKGGAGGARGGPQPQQAGTRPPPPQGKGPAKGGTQGPKPQRKGRQGGAAATPAT